MKKVLTDALLKTLRLPAEGRTEISDTQCQGLTIRVTVSGARSWSFRFRDPLSGKVTRATLGGYPDIPLKDARERATDLRRGVAKGINPVDERRRAKGEAETMTFAVLAERYIEEHAKRFKKDAAPDERALKLHVLPRWEARRYDQIRRRDVIELTESLVTAGTPIQANRVQALLSKVFAFAVDKDLIDAHPFPRLRKPADEVRATRVLTDDEIRLFWARAVEAPVSRRTGLALRLVLLTGVRVGEIAGADVRDFERLDDPTKATWTVPASRSKNGRAHVVPLGASALRIVEELVSLMKVGSSHLLASPRRPDEPIEGHALSTCMIRLAEAIGAAVEDGADEPGMATWAADRPTAHDLRRTMATRLGSLGVPGEDISACLNHTVRTVTAAHYNLYDRLREKRAALDLWASQLDAIVGGETHMTG